MRRVSLCSALFVLASCKAENGTRASEAERTDQQPAAALASAPSADWRSFQADGFSLRIPRTATTETALSTSTGTHGTAIQGSTISDSTGRRGPAWRLVVTSQLNPRHVPLEQWVDSIRNERNAASAGDPDSLAWLAAADSLQVGTERALRLQPFCGDCEEYEIFAPAFGRVIVFSIVYDIGVPGNRDEQRALYDAILSTYRPNPGIAFDHRPNDR